MSGMRAAVKSSALGGYRSIGSFAVRAAVAAGLRASHPAIATVSVEGGSSMSISSLDKGSQEVSPVSGVQKPWWEEEIVPLESLDPALRLVFGPVPTLEEAKEATSAVQKPWWEEEEIVPLESLHPAPRLVFGPVPTLEEAKEATSDLAYTLKEMCPLILSHSSTEVPHASVMLGAPVIPRHVAQTFALLQGNHQVQDVVASVVADKNVWDAVMNHPEVREFYNTHKSIVYPPESSCFVTEVPMADEDRKSSTAEPTKTSPFMDFIRRVKDKTVEVVINISTFMQDFFDPSTSKTGNEKDKPFVNATFGSSLMALVIATILVILFKRA